MWACTTQAARCDIQHRLPTVSTADSFSRIYITAQLSVDLTLSLSTKLLAAAGAVLYHGSAQKSPSGVTHAKIWLAWGECPSSPASHIHSQAAQGQQAMWQPQACLVCRPAPTGGRQPCEAISPAPGA